MLELVLLAQSVATPAPPAAPPDACVGWAPPGLAATLRMAEPGFELPKAADAGEARLQALAQNGAWPCPFIAIADFDGNGRLDRALLLKNPNPLPGTAVARLIAALNTDSGWQIKLAEDWGAALVDSYLQPMEPGLYQGSDASTTPAAELDLLETIQSDSPGFTVGKINDRYAAYFFQNGVWRHFWKRD